MSFGRNLQNARKASGLSQEELADKMEVSRQSISKWESGSSYPETEKLIELAKLLDCQIDDLINGTKEATKGGDLKEKYNTLMHKFSRGISLAVGLILLGVVLLLGFECFGEDYAGYGLIAFLSCIVVSVPIFVVRGIEMGHFKERYPQLDEFYTEAEIDRYNAKFPYMIGAAVGIILLGVVIMITLESIGVGQGGLSVAIFMLFITVAVPIFVYAGINKDKFDLKRYNLEGSPSYKSKAALVGKICGVIMLVATAFYLLVGFLLGWWDMAWVVFPIGGILCGIVGTIFSDKIRQ